MGVNNRQRRKAKQAKQAKRSVPRTSRPLADEPDVETVLLAVAGLTQQPDEQAAVWLAWLQEPRRAAEVAGALTRLLPSGISSALRSGWEPRDLGQVMRRQGGAAAVEVAVPFVLAAVRRTATDGRRRAWEEQVEALGTGRPLAPGSPGWPTALAGALAALGVLGRLTVLPDLAPLAAAPGRGDDRMFAKVRALMAKAESTEFAEEADALMAKAQGLMSRYNLDRALLEEGSGAVDVTAVRIWLDDPYVPAKGLLLATVARANRCKSVSSSAYGFVTLIGHPDDVAATEVLFTSLLVQATRRMMALAEPGQSPRVRRPAFRRSFLVAFSTRIGTRLEKASASETEHAVVEDARLLPVLARRESRVDGVVGQLFPDLTHQTFSATDHAGWAAGTAAADLADLAARPTLANGYDEATFVA